MLVQGIIYIHLKFQPNRFSNFCVIEQHIFIHTNFCVYNFSKEVSMLMMICKFTFLLKQGGIGKLIKATQQTKYRMWSKSNPKLLRGNKCIPNLLQQFPTTKWFVKKISNSMITTRISMKVKFKVPQQRGRFLR